MSSRRHTPVLIVILGLLGLIIQFCSCDPTPVTEWASNVQGTVTDSTTNKPIDSVMVSYPGMKPVFTDSTGHYVITKFGDPSSPVTASKEGYITQTYELDIVRRKQLYDKVNFKLVPAPVATE